MIRWLEGSRAHSPGLRRTVYQAETPFGLATIKPFFLRGKVRGIIGWRGRLADGTEIERANAQDCMIQLEQIIQLRLERDNARKRTAWLD